MGGASSVRACARPRLSSPPRLWWALFAAAAGPAFLRHGVGVLLRPWRAAEAAAPYRIDVSPGSVTVRRGADQRVVARLYGFGSGGADLLVRSGADAAFERVPMTAGEDSSYEAVVYRLSEATDYFVEAGGVRSPLYRIDVADLPYVRRLGVEYRFPDYTGLPPRTVEDGGDLAAVVGTIARLRVWSTVTGTRGRIVRGDGRAFPLEPGPDGTLTGELPIDRPGVYHLELRAGDGPAVTGSPDYTIDVLEDQPPGVSFEKPGRDTRATSVEEVFLQARAVDDYGVGRLEVVYAVNGGAEDTIRLYEPRGAPLKEVSAGHTLYLEEMGLQPGDVVSYFARAADTRPRAASGAGSATSDIYFVRIRDFRKDYHAAEQRGTPGGGGQQEQPGALSEQQKQVVAATFNLVRDGASLGDDVRREHRATIALAQGRVKEQVDGLVRRMRERNVAAMDSTFGLILSLLPKASVEMDSARSLLAQARDREALSPEQRALQYLQRAEEVYRDVQVALADANGGGGGGSSAAAEDLADLFQLEMDRLRNQYETLQRSQEQQTQEQLDEALERLKELARRQQQEEQRQRRLARGQGGAGAAASASGNAQRQLAEQAEEEARRLERLAHENPGQGTSLQESARRLRQAADELRRSAADPSSGGATAARDRLDQARRLLEQGQGDQLARRAAAARDRARQLADEQRDLADASRRLEEARQEAGSAGGGANGGGNRVDSADVRRLLDRKDQLASAVDEMESRLDQLSADARARDSVAAQRMADAAQALRDGKVADKVRFSRGLAEQGGAGDYARRLDDDVTQRLDSLGARLDGAADRIARAGAEERRDEETLERARSLARGAESLGQRLRDGAQGGGEQGRGAQGGDAQGRDAQSGGGPDSRSSPGGGGDSRPGDFSSDQVRQFRREARERLEDARALEGELRAEGRDAGDLESAIAALRSLTDAAPYRDPAAVERLQEAAVQGLKDVEFSLRRAIRGDDGQGVLLSGTPEVPERFRDLVEEYFRSLGKVRHPPR